MEAFAIGGILLVSIIATVIVVEAMKYSCQRIRRQQHIYNEQLNENLLRGKILYTTVLAIGGENATIVSLCT